MTKEQALYMFEDARSYYRAMRLRKRPRLRSIAQSVKVAYVDHISNSIIPYVHAWNLPLNPENCDEIAYTMVQAALLKDPTYPNGVDKEPWKK